MAERWGQMTPEERESSAKAWLTLRRLRSASCRDLS
jgi:hypothetical protein